MGSSIAELAAGSGDFDHYHATLQCLRLASASTAGSVYCWGDDWGGALGIGDPDDLATATPVPGLTGVTAITTSIATTTLLMGGSVSYAGDSEAFTPSFVDQTSFKVLASLGTGNTGARSFDNGPYGYVVKSGGALGYFTGGHMATGQGLLNAPSGTTFSDAIPCSNYDIGLTLGGSVLVYAIGDDGSTTSYADADGIFGDAMAAPSTKAGQIVTVPGVSGATSLAAYCDDFDGAPSHACVIGSGAVTCWGGNHAGESGNATVGPTPVAATAVTVAGETFTSVAVGDYFSCATAQSGKVYCWGADGNGELGDGNGQNSATPVMVLGITNAKGVTAAAGYACAWLSDGTAQCWGANDSHQLGDGTLMTQVTPVPVLSGTTPLANVQAISASEYHACALLTGGGVACWGSCYAGECGAGVSGTYPTPQPVQGLMGP
jgi:alpha-tubulin suppressor-like RCC1 family protein